MYLSGRGASCSVHSTSCMRGYAHLGRRRHGSFHFSNTAWHTPYGEGVAVPLEAVAFATSWYRYSTWCILVYEKQTEISAKQSLRISVHAEVRIRARVRVRVKPGSCEADIPTDVLVNLIIRRWVAKAALRRPFHIAFEMFWRVFGCERVARWKRKLCLFAPVFASCFVRSRRSPSQRVRLPLRSNPDKNPTRGIRRPGFRLLGTCRARPRRVVLLLAVNVSNRSIPKKAVDRRFDKNRCEGLGIHIHEGRPQSFAWI